MLHLISISFIQAFAYLVNYYQNIIYTNEKISKNSHLAVDLCRAGGGGPVSGGAMRRGGWGKGQEISVRVQHRRSQRLLCICRISTVQEIADNCGESNL